MSKEDYQKLGIIYALARRTRLSHDRSFSGLVESEPNLKKLLCSKYDLIAPPPLLSTIAFVCTMPVMLIDRRSEVYGPHVDDCVID